MSAQYVQKTANKDVNGNDLPFDATVRYYTQTPTDPMMQNLINVIECSTGVLRHRLTQDVFDAKYEEVEGNQPTAPATIPVQAADGAQFVLTVQDDGTVTAAPVGTPNS